MQIEWENKESVVAAVNRWPEIFRSEIKRFLRASGQIAASRSAELAPVGTGTGPAGHLSNSIQVGQPVATGSNWTILYGTPAAYGETIEMGRRPGSRRPPIQAIATWVWYKRFLFPSVETQEDAKRLAYPIARAIGDHGFRTAWAGLGKGWKFLERGGKQSLPQIKALGAKMRQRIEHRCTEDQGSGGHK